MSIFMSILLITLFYFVVAIAAIATIQSLSARLIIEFQQTYHDYHKRKFQEAVDWFLSCGCSIENARYRAVLATS